MEHRGEQDQAATNQRMLKGRNRELIDMIGFP